ncbi:MAG: hypothetical protein WC528_04775 [Patescibacteria group bacterium]
MNIRIYKNQRGVVAILTLLAVSVLALLIMTTMSVLAADELKMSISERNTEKTFYAAETGINEALYRLSKDGLPANFCLSFDGTAIPCANSEKIEVSFSLDPNNPYNRIINSRAQDITGKERTLSFTAQTNSYAAGLDFAVHTGTGGLEMENNTRVYGNIHSNGNIYGSTGGTPKSEIYGDIKVSGITTNLVQTFSYDLRYADNTLFKHLNGNLHAHEIVDSKISGDACYQIINSSTVSGSSEVYGSNPNCISDPAPATFPITDPQIENWTNEIKDHVNEAILNGTGQLFPTNKTVNTSETWGPTKVNGNLIIQGSPQGVNKLVMNDNLWVIGNLEIQNNGQLTLFKNILVSGNIIFYQNSTINLDPSVGENDGLIIVNGKTEIKNVVSINGSGNSKSSLMLISTNNSLDTDNPAILANNVSNGVLYYAKDGKITIDQNGDLCGTIAHTIHLKNGATVRYKPDKQILDIPPNDDNYTFGPVSGSWQEK